MIATTRFAAALAVAALLISSAKAEPFARTVPIDYATFAACAYSILDREYPEQIQLTDLRAINTIKIVGTITSTFITSGTSRWLDMTIRKSGKGSTVEIEPQFTVRGDDFYAQKTWSEIQGCIPQ